MQNRDELTDLDKLKTKIENMTKIHHIEILKILKKNCNVKLNENKSGVYVNLSFLTKETIAEIEEYLNYVDLQEISLNEFENQKEEFKNTYFLEKEVKDEPQYYNSITK